MTDQQSQLNNIERAIGRLEGKFEQINESTKDMREDLKLHLEKVDILEEKVATMEGRAGVWGGIGGIVATAIIGFVFWIFQDSIKK